MGVQPIRQSQQSRWFAMTLEDDENYEETPSSALEPGVNGMEVPKQEDEQEVEDGEPSGQPAANESSWRQWYRQLKPVLGYLPTGEFESDTERDGILSYAVEVHATVIGLSAGVAAASAGDMQLVMALVAIALGVGRAQQQFSESVREQVVKEPAYALAGVAIGWGAIHVAETGQLPI